MAQQTRPLHLRRWAERVVLECVDARAKRCSVVTTADAEGVVSSFAQTSPHPRQSAQRAVILIRRHAASPGAEIR